MSAATSPGTGLAYGLRRVCAAWGMARSSFYAMTSGQHAEQPPAKRRGPKPAISDQALLVAIEADLEASPWELTSPRPDKCPIAAAGGGNPHDGEIITQPSRLSSDSARSFASRTRASRTSMRTSGFTPACRAWTPAIFWIAKRTAT